MTKKIVRDNHRQVFKYPLTIDDKVEIEALPGEVLCVQVQNGVPCLWILVNRNKKVRTRTFYVVGTGHPMPVSITADNYVGTFQLNEGSLVFHVFEEV